MNKHLLFPCLCACLGSLSIIPAAAGEPQVLTSRPVAALRDLSTDRPDKTESPLTVDAGHLQIESDLINWSHNRDSGVKTDALDIGTLNLKIGITDSLDFQTILQPYHYERQRSHGYRYTEDGFGDITLRAKYNFWGNDGETATAFAIMPFVTLPTARGDFGANKVEGGVILPLSVDLPKGWSLGLMTELDFVSEEDGGHTTHIINSASFSRDLTENIGMYVEFFSEIPTENSKEWIGTIDTGLTIKITPNIQLDAGINFGITDAADDLNPFLGCSVRF